MAACEGIGAVFQETIRQRDLYFRVPEGRFKLRESDPGEDYLVFYRRPDVAEAKGCDYEIAVVDRSVAPVLRAALGQLAVVEKNRTLYLWQNVRIHLDEVQGLGAFIEFEAVLSDTQDDADGFAKLEFLQERFGLSPDDIEAASYVELVLESGSGD